MFNRSIRKFVQLALIIGLAGGTALIAANKVSAAEKVLSGRHSFGEVAAACGSGGHFAVAMSGGYSCSAESGNTVVCNAKGQCTSSCYGKNCPAVVKGLVVPLKVV
jgi:hypothetical protein